MVQQVIDVGNVANDGQGDPLRTAFEKTNSNFTELFNIGGVSGIANGTSNISILENSTVSVSASNVANVLVVSSTGATLQGTFLANTTISATGNIVAGGLFLGNGSQLTGVVSSAPAALITGTTLSSNVVNSSLTSVGTLGSLTVTANVTGGNLLSAGLISATGNVNATNMLAGGVVQATGNVTGGNLTTAGEVSAAGNITSGGTVTALAFVGNGAGLTGFTVSSNASLLTGTTMSSNVTISSLRELGNLNSLTVSNALGGTGAITTNSLSAGTTVVATGNITGGNVISLASISAVSGNFTADIVSGANVSAVLGNVIGNNIISNASVETATLSASGNVQAAGYTGSAMSLSGNVLVGGNVTATNLTGTLTTATQTAITSVGTLGSLLVSGNVTGGNINISGGGILTTTGNVIGANFVGNVVGNVTGTVSAPGSNTQIVFNDSGLANATAGFTFDKTSNAVVITGNITAANMVSSGVLSATSNIRGLSNIVVDGQFGYFNTTNTAFVDPIVSVGRLANNTALISNDGDDRGTELFYYDTSEKRAFIGFVNASNPNPAVPAGKLLAATGVTVSAENVTGISTYGSFVVGTLEGNAVTVTANVLGGNIVSNAAVTGTTLSASGNITGGNLITSGIANIATLEVTSIANVKATTDSTSTSTGALRVAGGAGIVGNVYSGNANVAGTVTSATLSVTGNTATVTTANYQIGYRDLPQLTSFGTLALTDGGKHYYGSGTIGIPLNASVALPIGTALMIIATGSTTVANASGVSLIQAGTGSTGQRTIAAYGQASLVKVDTNTWYISGVGIT